MDDQNGTKLATIDQPEGKLANSLQIDESGLTIVKAPNIGSVLPIQFYEGAGELFLDQEQTEKLMTVQDCPEEEIDVRPDGLIYVRHGWYERRLTEIFGPGGWAMVPATNIQMEQSTQKIYCIWVLRCRGADGKTCFVGQAVGWAQWMDNNPRANKADSFEVTRSDAIVKIVAKSSLGIGSNLWDKRFSRAWRNKNCVQVKIKTYKGVETQWRRKDEEPYDNEIGIETPQRATAPAPQSEPSVQSPAAAEVTPATPAAPPTGRGKDAAARTSGVIMDSQFRLFLVRARRHGLIDGENAGEALSFVCGQLNKVPQSAAGKTSIEVLRDMILGCNRQEFQKLIEAVDKYEPPVPEEAEPLPEHEYPNMKEQIEGQK